MKNIFRLTSFVGVLVVFALAAACSDGGALKLPEPPAPAAPIVTAEAVVPGGTPDQSVSLDTSTDANSASLKVVSGTGVEIRWDIKGVVSGQLASNPDVLGGAVPIEVDAATHAAVGSRFVPALTSDTTFTITAVNQEGTGEDAPKTEVEVTIQVNVVPAAATTGGEEETSGPVEPTVPVEFKIASFTANGVDGSMTLDAAGNVKLAWEVVPSDKATVSIDNGVGEDLPAKGEAVVSVGEDKIFTLKANYNDQTISRQVVVNVKRVVVVQQLDVQLSASVTSVFAGEPVVLGWKISSKDGSEAALDGATINLVGPEGTLPVSGNSTEVKSMVSGAYSIEVAVNGGIYKSNVVNISVRSWDAKKIGLLTRGIEVLNDGQTVLFGVTGDVEKKGKGNEKSYELKLGKMVGNELWEEIVLDMKKVFSPYVEGVDVDIVAGFNNDSLLLQNPFTVGAFSVDETKDGGNRVYIGGTGFVAYSTNGGLIWKALDVFPVMKKKIKELPTCKGDKHVSKAKTDDYMQNLNQICDLLVDTSTGVDRLVAAMDKGILYVTDVDKRINDKTNYWKVAEDMKDVVANSIVSYGGKLFAGTAKGIWVSENAAENWSAYNGGEISDSIGIYALAIDSANKKIYAGGPDGAYINDAGGTAEWKKAGDLTEAGTVYSIVVDPVQSGTIYAGTENGVYVSRNYGESWTNVSESMGSVSVVYGLAVSKKGANVGIYAATSNGAYSSIEPAFSTAKLEPVPVQPVEPAVPTSAINVIKSLAK